MNSTRHRFDVLVVGGGPAGIAAACCAAESGAKVGLVDNNAVPGGQIWRGAGPGGGHGESEPWRKRLAASKTEILSATEVFDQAQEGLLLADSERGVCELGYKKLILCTGARERFLPFPGWTLPNVVGAGGLQALVKSGLPIEGKKVVVAGSGPLLVAVGAYLREQGADLRAIAEQASWGRLARFGFALAFQPQKISQGLALKRQLRGVPFHANCRPVRAAGEGKLEGVTLRSGAREWNERCDYLACGFHLVPNTELAVLLGCQLRGGSVRVDAFQQTSVSGIFCAGEPTGIGGVERSLAEGQIAGYGASGRPERARRFFGARKRARRFAAVLETAFALGRELRSLPEKNTFVCRCEDVTFGRMQGYSSWRAAKLHTRSGMGPCQGRVCGPAAEFLFGWKAESIRPPIYPVAVRDLAAVGATAADHASEEPK